MVARHGWPQTFEAPTVFRLVDSPEACLVLKHQPNAASSVENFAQLSDF
jgi:hypothetical protein